MSNLFHEAPTLCNDAAAQRVLGELVTDEVTGYQYRYVQFKDAVTYAAGQSLTWADVACTTVTNDRAGGSSLGAIPAGICLRVMTQNYYGFILVRGKYAGLVTSGADDIAVGESLIVHASTDGACDGVAANATTTASFGICLEDDDNTANTTKGTVNIM